MPTSPAADASCCFYPSGGTTVAADKLPKAFLDSWGITAAKLDAAKAAAERQTQLEIDQAVRGGLFREVEGVVYDLRKPQAGWTRLSGAKILQISPPARWWTRRPTSPTRPLILSATCRPSIRTAILFRCFAKATGPFSYINRFGYERTVRSYDAGRACARNEIPCGDPERRPVVRPSARWT
jgi:hypothetical protein